MASLGDQVAVGLVSSQLIGDCCFLFVALFWLSACCTSVVGSNVKSMRPAIIHVVEESGASVASGRSGAVDGFAGGPVGCFLDGC